MSGGKNTLFHFLLSNQLMSYTCFLPKFSARMLWVEHLICNIFLCFPFKHFSDWLAISTTMEVILLFPLLESLPRIPKIYFTSNYCNYPGSWYFYYRINFFMVCIFKMLFNPTSLRLILKAAQWLHQSLVSYRVA